MAHLEIDVETCGFTIYWRIENFDCEPCYNFSILSEVFTIKSLNSKWQIEVAETDGVLCAYLFKRTNRTTFFIYYSMYVLTDEGWMVASENLKQRFTAGGDGSCGDITNLEMLKENEWYYLPNGSLTVSFHIWNDRIRGDSVQRLMISRLRNGNDLHHRPIQTFSTLKRSDLLYFPHSYQFQDSTVSNLDLQMAKEVKTQHIQSDDQKPKEVKTQQTQTDTNYKDLDDLRKLFKEKEFSFVTLRTPTKEFSVHKAVLCAKSPVFNAMFGRKMKEDDCNIVDIDDIDNQTMALFVKFLHFEPLGDLKWEAAVSLYYPADKYQIDSLKELCVSLLKKELSIENVCDILRLADLHQDSGLMNCAQEYFCKNSKVILPSSQWKEMLGHTELVANILCKLAENMH